MNAFGRGRNRRREGVRTVWCCVCQENATKPLPLNFVMWAMGARPFTHFTPRRSHGGPSLATVPSLQLHRDELLAQGDLHVLELLLQLSAQLVAERPLLLGPGLFCRLDQLVYLG
jgi:hypothetical protein